MTTVFLSGINSARYGALLNYLHNAFRMGCNEYPKTLTSAYDLAINWKGDTKGIGVTPMEAQPSPPSQKRRTYTPQIG